MWLTVLMAQEVWSKSSKISGQMLTGVGITKKNIMLNSMFLYEFKSQ